MERARIILMAFFVLIGSALIFVFRYKSKEKQAIKNKMAEVRAAKGLKKYVSQLENEENEEIEINAGEKSE